jgi:steroid delta-isomerase-like uncharacterized protein
MSTIANKTLVRRYYDDVLTQRDTTLLDTLLAPSFVSYLPNGTPISRDQYVQAIAMSHNAFPDLQVTIHDQIAEGEKVVTRWSARGTHLGTFAGIPATGKPITVTAMHIHRVADGKLMEHWEEINLFSVMQQLGVLPQ